MIVMEWIVHDSHDKYFRNPFGAVVCGTEINIRIKIETDQKIESVTLRFCKNDQDLLSQNMALTEEEGNIKTFESSIRADDEPGLIWYFFMIIKDGRVFYYGNNHRRLGGKGEIQEHIPPAYQITVYKAGFTVPEWFKEALMYQIFVDRFYNGNENGRVLKPKKGSLIHGNWDDTPFYIRNKDMSIKRWTYFGGNLAGVIKKLKYLKELGVSVIYLNPIFESSSSHKYDTADYKNIDSMFGSNEIFCELCQKANDLGIQIILDGVFSHTGSDSIYFNREGNYPGLGAYQSPDSPYYSWYRFYEYPDKYDCWWGIGTMPNVNEMEPSYQAFIIDGEDSVIKHWMKKGAKGWRLDVADELPDTFIKKMRRTMKEIDAESILIGEVWEDASNKVSYGQKRQYLWGEELDSVMNYIFRKNSLDFILGKLDAVDLHKNFMSLYENYPREVFYSLMNLIGTHDVPRILTILGEGVKEERLSETGKERTKLKPGQRKMAIARLKLLVLLQMTFPGVPCIYYGDEVGMEGYSDPFNRGPYPWGNEDNQLLAWYKQIISLREKYPALKKGNWKPLYALRDVYGYIRENNGEEVIVILNRSVKETVSMSVQLDKYENKNIYNALTGEEKAFDADGRINIELLPLEGKILTSYI